MRTKLLLSILADDQPGIVEKISSVVHQHQALWQQSQLSRLSGKFAGIIEIVVDEQNQAALERDLLALVAFGIRITIDLATASDEGSGVIWHLQVTAGDRPGIVAQVSRCLASMGVNVLQWHSEVVSAAMSAEPLFVAQAELLGGPSVDIEQLTVALEGLSDDLIVELDLEQL